MLLSRYFLQGILLISMLIGCLEAKEGIITYEKFYRLNRPLNVSDSGDLINLSLQSLPVDMSKTIDYFGMGDFHLYFEDNNSFNYSLQEAYLHYNGDSYTLSIGRKILDWNQNEKYWTLGYLNASQAFTLLSTEEEGVSAAVFKKSYGPFEFYLLLSYLFIPQINPAVDIKDGEIKSQSDWIRLPPKKTTISGAEVPIYYKISDYKVSDIVLNKSLGANIKYNWNEGGVSAFAIYKPENKLRVNASAYYDNISKIIVEAAPSVNHHAYYGVQVFQAFGDVKTRGGLSYVDPNARLGKDIPLYKSDVRSVFTSDYFTINPRYDKEAYSHLSANLEQKSYILSLNYIHLLTSNIRGSDDFFSDTVKWKRAFGANLTWMFSDTFHFLIDLKYDIARFDNIVKSELIFNFKNQIRLSFGIEILKAPQDNSYWSYYRTNDTLYSSIGFAF